MPAIITNKFRIHNAEQFVESFSESSPNVYYMGIGRPQAYATSTRGDARTENEGTDSSPITPADTVKDEFYYFDDLLAAKKVQATIFLMFFLEETGQLAQFTIITDMITEIELQVALQYKQQIVVQLLYGTLLTMLYQATTMFINV